MTNAHVLIEKPIDIARCPSPVPPPDIDWSTLNVTSLAPFQLSSSAKQSPQQQTSVFLCYDKGSRTLLIKFQAVDNNPINPLRGCNAPLFQYDVVETFLSNGTTGGHNYLELEVSPFAQLFASYIYNPNLDCPGIQGTPLNCTALSWKAAIQSQQNRWWAFLGVPLALLEPLPHDSTITANFFRIDQPLPQNEREFSCWHSTEKTPACFHRPRYFGQFRLPLA
jgi:hypothetical protein